MPSGLVEFRGTNTTYPGGFGTNPAMIEDRDFTTTWAYATATGGRLGMNMGVPVVVTRIRYAPQLAAGEDVPGDKTIYGAQVKSSTNGWPTFASEAVVYIFGSMDEVFYPARQLSSIEIPSSTARAEWGITSSQNVYGPQCAELRWDGPYVSGANASPVPPTISPWGGRFPGGSTIVSASCLTTSATLYYTTDGSTPDNTDTPFTGTLNLDFSAGPVTLKVRAYDAGLSTPYSDTVSAVFEPWSFKANGNIYDDEGNLVEAHGGNFLDDRSRSGYWYWYGAFTNRLNVGVEVRPNVGVWCYRSTDLMNWEKVGYILPNVVGFTHVERPRVVYNSNNATYVCFGHLKNGPGDSRMGIATATDPEGPWSWVVTNFDPSGTAQYSRDFNVWLESDGDCWVVYTNEANTSCRISRLNSTFTGLHATPQHTTIIGADREAPVMLKIGTGSSARRFLITSDANAYDYTSTFDVKYLTQTGSNPASGWPSIANMAAFDAVAVTLFASDPVNTDLANQPTAVIPYNNGYIFVGDHWNPVALYNSRSVFLPLIVDGATIEALLLTDWNIWNYFTQIDYIGGGFNGIISDG